MSVLAWVVANNGGSSAGAFTTTRASAAGLEIDSFSRRSWVLAASPPLAAGVAAVVAAARS
jgi:hypothetical protein